MSYNDTIEPIMNNIEQQTIAFSTFSIEETNRNVKRISIMNIVTLIAIFCITAIVLILVAIILRQQSSFSDLERRSLQTQSDIKFEFYSLCVRLLTPDQCVKPQ